MTRSASVTLVYYNQYLGDDTIYEVLDRETGLEDCESLT